MMTLTSMPLVNYFRIVTCKKIICSSILVSLTSTIEYSMTSQPANTVAATTKTARLQSTIRALMDLPVLSNGLSEVRRRQTESSLSMRYLIVLSHLETQYLKTTI